jgi:hypothetical protein
VAEYEVIPGEKPHPSSRRLVWEMRIGLELKRYQLDILGAFVELALADESITFAEWRSANREYTGAILEDLLRIIEQELRKCR